MFLGALQAWPQYSAVDRQQILDYFTSQLERVPVAFKAEGFLDKLAREGYTGFSWCRFSEEKKRLVWEAWCVAFTHFMRQFRADFIRMDEVHMDQCISTMLRYVNNSELLKPLFYEWNKWLHKIKAPSDYGMCLVENILQCLSPDDADRFALLQELLQEKINLQNENIEIVNTKINDINNKIAEKEEKINQLEIDIENKQKDIDIGLEEFKSRLRAMYISGNDSLASALVGATDFYDMLSKIEIISQVSKHDNELVNSLMTQLEQFEEAQTQLDIEKTELNANLAEQEECKKELNAAIIELNNDYQESQDYIDRQQAEIASRQADIDQYEADNNAMDAEIAEINEIARQQAEAAAAAAATSQQSSNEENSNNSYSEDNSENDSSDDSAAGGGDNSGDGEIGGSSGTGSYSGALTWPVPGFYSISSGYGYRWGSLHAGIDIAGGGIHGASIVSAGSGTVTLVKSGCSHDYGKDSSCGCNGGYGNYVMVDHGNGISTLYAHCSAVYVSVGQSVSAGETIASVGSTGWSTGNHCHFEVRVNGSTVDPTGYLY